MKILKKFQFLSVILFLVFTASCVETVVVGSFSGAALATREKNLNDTRHDIVIYTTLNTDFLQNGLKNFGNSINITVNEGRVLLTGIARDIQKAKLAAKISWNVAGVKEVIDEIQVRDGDYIRFKDFASGSYDYLITSKIETKMLFAKRVPTFNYKITTVNKTVYIIGVAYDEAEIARVIKLITTTNGVEKVVSHAILVNDRRRNAKSR